MSSKQGVTQTLRRVGGDGGQGASYFDDMTPAELEERDAGIKAYEAIQARQEAYMARRQAEAAAQQSQQKPERRGCVFAKCSKLPDAVIQPKTDEVIDPQLVYNWSNELCEGLGGGCSGLWLLLGLMEVWRGRQTLQR